MLLSNALFDLYNILVRWMKQLLVRHIIHREKNQPYNKVEVIFLTREFICYFIV